jgi:glyoxylase-like metal-dependent hydrolase (beta-lactamase superfamily II)
MFIVESLMRWSLLVPLFALACSGCAGLLLTRPAPDPDPDAPRADPASASLRLPDGREVVVHALPTGNVAVKGCHQVNCLDDDAGYMERFFQILQDDTFAEPMPIWAYLIEHPDGRFLVDTGETPAFYDRSTWRGLAIPRRVSHSILQLDIREDEALSARLSALGVASDDVDAVVLTHLHVDHTGGLRDLPGVPAYTSKHDVDAADDIGAAFDRNLAGVDLRYLEDGGTQTLSADDTLVAMHTPGHTSGSLSVRLQTDAGAVWFVGDTIFRPEDLDGTETAGIHVEMDAVRDRQDELRDVRDDGALLLTAHDWGVPAALGQFAAR